MTGSLTLEAPAKINLTLEVLRRRDDGYHEVAILLQTVSLFDTLFFEEAEDVTLQCSDPSLVGPDNLALRAARALWAATGTRRGAAIYLDKRIPVAAGLGGGSTDAAAALLGLDRLWGLGLSHERLAELAAGLGSDVPFFLRGGAGLCLSRGERVEHLPSARLPSIVLLCPDIDVPQKTATVYGRVTPDRYTSGALTMKLAGRIRAGGDVPDELLFNALEDVAMSVFPGLADYRDALLGLGARSVHLSGAGPSLYALIPDRSRAVALRSVLARGRGWRAYLLEPWSPPDS